MRRLLIAAVAILGVWACGQSAGTDQNAQTDTLTRRQRDSTIAEMGLPGSSAVGSALDAADRAAERAEAHDTIR